jgi:hypothetical protein
MDAHGVLLGTTKEGYLVAAFPNLRYAAAFLTSHDFGNLDDALVTEPTTIPGHPPLRRG